MIPSVVRPGGPGAVHSPPEVPGEPDALPEAAAAALLPPGPSLPGGQRLRQHHHGDQVMTQRHLEKWLHLTAEMLTINL